jgi:hypothetical protein
VLCLFLFSGVSGKLILDLFLCRRWLVIVFFFEIHPLWARPFDGFALVFSLDCDVLCAGVGALAVRLCGRCLAVGFFLFYY